MVKKIKYNMQPVSSAGDEVDEEAWAEEPVSVPRWNAVVCGAPAS